MNRFGPGVFCFLLIFLALLFEIISLCISSFTGVQGKTLFEIIRAAKNSEKLFLISGIHLAAIAAYASLGWNKGTANKKRYFQAISGLIASALILFSATSLVMELYTQKIAITGTEYGELNLQPKVIYITLLALSLIFAHSISKASDTPVPVCYTAASAIGLMITFYAIGIIPFSGLHFNQALSTISIQGQTLIAVPMVICAMFAEISRRADKDYSNALPLCLMIIVPFGITGSIQIASKAASYDQISLGLVGETSIIINALWPLAAYYMLRNIDRAKTLRLVTLLYGAFMVLSMPVMRLSHGAGLRTLLIEAHAGISFAFCYGAILIGIGILIRKDRCS